MNKFETKLLETLASIDASLKAIAAGSEHAAKLAAKASAKPAAQAAKATGNGAAAKPARRTAAPEKGAN